MMMNMIVIHMKMKVPGTTKSLQRVPNHRVLPTHDEVLQVPLDRCELLASILVLWMAVVCQKEAI